MNFSSENVKRVCESQTHTSVDLRQEACAAPAAGAPDGDGAMARSIVMRTGTGLATMPTASVRRNPPPTTPQKRNECVKARQHTSVDLGQRACAAPAAGALDGDGAT